MGEWERLKEQGKEERGGERSIKGKLGKDLNGWLMKILKGRELNCLHYTNLLFLTQFPAAHHQRCCTAML